MKNRLSTLVLTFLVSMVIFGCTKGLPNCDSDIVKDKLFDIMIKRIDFVENPSNLIGRIHNIGFFTDRNNMRMCIAEVDWFIKRDGKILELDGGDYSFAIKRSETNKEGFEVDWYGLEIPLIQELIEDGKLLRSDS